MQFEQVYNWLVQTTQLANLKNQEKIKIENTMFSNVLKNFAVTSDVIASLEKGNNTIGGGLVFEKKK